MQATSTYHVVGHHGITFQINEVTVQPSDRSRLNQLCLTAARQDNYRVIDLILEVYDRMQANDRPCWLRVAISSPISRSQADLLNEQRNSAGALFGSAVSPPIGTITPIGGFVVGAWSAPMSPAASLHSIPATESSVFKPNSKAA